ncbi:MAG: glycosyltransferase family 4 protein [Thermoplasmata archaeon]|nr:glycosyltransferase family 4 protein [Thermoplasmata archaeon]
MRVLMVSRASYPLPASQGGTDAYALRTATYLVPQGHQVFLVGQGQPGPAFGEVRFVRVPARVQVTSRLRVAYFLKGFLLNIASVLTATKFLRKDPDRIDIVHCNSNLAVVLLGLLFPGKPLVYTMHDPLVLPQRARPATWIDRLIRPINNGLFERWALRRAAHVIAVSSEIRTQAEQVIGDSRKLTLLYPFSRPAHAVSTDTGPSEAIEPPYVLSVGAQTGRKRFDLLIRALALIPSSIGLVLVGSGSDRPRLGRCAREVGVTERVVFLDHVNDDQLLGLYREASVYALASTREGFPATLIEAALNGTPTLYFTDAAHADLERSQSDFFRVIHSLEPERMADAINRTWAGEPGRVPDRGRIAQWARSRFPPPEAVAGAIDRIYAGVVGPMMLREPAGVTA